MSYSILIPGSIAAKNNDSLNVLAKCTGAALENGNVVILGALSTARGESEVYIAATPNTGTLSSEIYYMVNEPVLPLINSKYRGLTDDPREFNIAANTVFTCYKPQVGDMITISTDGLAGVKGVNQYVVPATGTNELTWAASASGVTLAYQLKGTTTISVGSASVTAYKFMCVLAS